MKILVVMKNWLGDLLFQMPALDLIRKRYPEASITCMAPERCREILEAHPAVTAFLSFDEKSTHRAWSARLKFLAALRNMRPWDQGYLFHRSRTRAVLLMLAGVRERIGFRRGRSFFLTKPLPEPSRPLHQVDFFFDLMHKAGFELPEKKVYQFYFKEEDSRQADEILKVHGLEKGARFICFHLGANWEPKRWPANHFASLAEKIHAKWQFPIVVTGSSQDSPLFDSLKQCLSKAKIISLVGKTPLRAAACIYQRALCLVTGDSGPMHIASGVGASVVALFGPTDPDLTGPRGTGDNIVLQFVPPGYSVPFYGSEFPEEGWLSQIMPEQVFEAVEKIVPR